MTWYHGTADHFDPGDEVVPLGTPPRGLPEHEHWRSQHVWLAEDPRHAAVWAEGKGGVHVYEVEPSAEPTWHYPSAYDHLSIEDENVARDQHYAPSARVVRRVDSAEQKTAGVRPDGIYDPDYTGVEHVHEQAIRAHVAEYHPEVLSPGSKTPGHLDMLHRAEHDAYGKDGVEQMSFHSHEHDSVIDPFTPRRLRTGASTKYPWGHDDDGQRREAGKGKPRARSQGRPGDEGPPQDPAQPVGQGDAQGAPGAGEVEPPPHYEHPKVAKDLKGLGKPQQRKANDLIGLLASGERHPSTHPLQSLKGWHSTKVDPGTILIHQHVDGVLNVGFIGSQHDYEKAKRRLSALTTTATDWHQFDTNHDYRWGHQAGSKGEFEEHDRITKKLESGQDIDDHEIDFMVGHAAGQERAREIAHGNHMMKQVWEEHGKPYEASKTAATSVTAVEGVTAWHITHDPEFRINPDHRPNGPNGKPSKEPYLSLTTDPEAWLDRGRDWMAGRTHAAEVEVVGPQGHGWAHTTYAGLPETRVWGDALRDARVRRVIPIGDLPGRKTAAVRHVSDDASDGDGITEGIMVAIVPPASMVENLAIEEGERPEQLHITLAYLGKTSEYSEAMLADLPELIEAWAEGHAPFEATAQGAGTFVKADEEGQHVLWASVDAPPLTRMHVELVDYLKEQGFEPREDHSFTPHLTLAYGKHHFRFLPKVERRTWKVREVWCCVGGRWESFRLRGTDGRTGT